MQEHELTLEELSERTGVEARTLRSWISEGLLSPPYKAGRGARYPASNVDRALAVRALKDVHGLSLAEIGRQFMMATQEQIRSWAAEASPSTAPPGSARDYLRRIQPRGGKMLPAETWASSYAPPDAFHDSGLPNLRSKRSPSSKPGFPDELRAAELANIEKLILQLEQVLGLPAPRRARGAIWTRISITPDLELSVRGDLEPRDRVLFEQLADQFRAILTGGTKND